MLRELLSQLATKKLFRIIAAIYIVALHSAIYQTKETYYTGISVLAVFIALAVRVKIIRSESGALLTSVAMVSLFVIKSGMFGYLESTELLNDVIYLITIVYLIVSFIGITILQNFEADTVFGSFIRQTLKLNKVFGYREERKGRRRF